MRDKLLNDGGPAFPVWKLNVYGQPEMTGFGMTLRDYFAAKAMQSIRSCPEWQFLEMKEIAAFAYKQADAMLKAREEA